MSDPHGAIDAATRLVALYQLRFGGKRNGRFRISRKYLHELSGRKRLNDRYLRDIADEIFEFGYVFINLESYYVVLDQNLFTGYRRVTGNAMARLAEQGFEDLASGADTTSLDINNDEDQESDDGN